MLYRLSADRPQFKTLTFHPGLNIVLATRDNDENRPTHRRSRNGAGKSSIVDLVHFLLGGKAEGALASPVLSEWSFTLELDVGRQRHLVARSVGDPRQVSVQRSRAGQYRLTNTQWCQQLGEAWFKLTEKRGRGDTSYRQLFSYFARRRRDGGLDLPTKTFRTQSAANSETSLAELFGLDAELVRQLHQTKAALKQTKDAQSALVEIDKASAAGSRRADLEAQIEAQIAAVKLGRDRMSERIAAFNVLPAFRELESELAGLNQEFGDLSDNDVIDTEAIEVNSRALDTETSADTPDIARLFSEAQIVFPNLVRDRYDEVRRFHEQLIENRQSHLQNEVRAARRRIQARQPLRQSIEERRREITKSLRSSGPADELLRLRDELAGREAQLRQLEGRLKEARKLEERIEQLELQLEDSVRALRQDRRERSSIVDLASTTFSEISERLYEQPGSLAISATDKGLRFLPTTPFDKSAGVMSMEIFCFDLTIASLVRRRGEGPGFILHDSHLFEPVDGRQFARALQIAAKFSIDNGLQYIALLNSDELDRAEREAGISFAQYVLKTELSDTPNGGLFGSRFE